MIQRVCIVGLGLMGGAVGLAVRRAKTGIRVIGVADRPETIEKAKAIGAVDDATLDLTAALQDADLVVLAVPVRLIPEVANAVIQGVADGTIITDLGSTKGSVVHECEKLVAHYKKPVHFIGSHPITGSEKTGIAASIEVNLEGATCVLTPTGMTDHEAYRGLEEFWRGLKMKTIRMPPEEHDSILAKSSHLPHLISYALITAQNDRSLNLSGPGLRDMTRLSGGDVALWTDIFMQNAQELSKVVGEFAQEINRLAMEMQMLARNEEPMADAARERMFRYLADARQRHDKRFTAVVEPEEARESNIRHMDTRQM